MSVPKILVVPYFSRIEVSKKRQEKGFQVFSYTGYSFLRLEQKWITSLNIPGPLTLYVAPAINSLIITTVKESKAPFPFTIRRMGSTNYLSTKIGDNFLPPPSVETEINDYEVHPGFILIRWPVLFYANSVVTPGDRYRTISRQLRESEFIEKSFKPLGERPDPYPFFVPQQPLDPFWAPPINPNVPSKLDNPVNAVMESKSREQEDHA